MHARYYSPTLGRFLSVDPARDADPSRPQSLNQYTYVRNNPVLLNDPSGLSPECKTDACITVTAKGDAEPSYWGTVAREFISKSTYDLAARPMMYLYAGILNNNIKQIAQGTAEIFATSALGGYAASLRPLGSPLVLGQTVNRVETYAAKIGGGTFQPGEVANVIYRGTGSSAGTLVENTVAVGGAALGGRPIVFIGYDAARLGTGIGPANKIEAFLMDYLTRSGQVTDVTHLLDDAVPRAITPR
jgi:hypothetical protein